MEHDKMEHGMLVEIIEEIIKVDIFPKLKAIINKMIEEAKEKINDPKAIRDKLESLTNDQRLHSSAIQGLIPLIESHAVSRPQKQGGGGDTIRYADLSSQADGSTKTFTISRAARILLVLGTQAPIGYRPDTDWTFATATRILTLTDAVSAPQTGQTLIALYVEN